MRLVNEPFDGEKVIAITFSRVPIYGRFFEEDGSGYTKITPLTYIDDRFCNEIACCADALVLTKENDYVK